MDPSAACPLGISSGTLRSTWTLDETHEIRVIRVRRQPFVRVGHISHLEIGGEIPESTVMCLPDGTDPTNDLFRLFRGGRYRGDETEPKVVLIRRRHVTYHDRSSAD